MSFVIPAANTNPKCKMMLHDLLTSIEKGEYENWPTIVCFDNCGHYFVKETVAKFPWIVPIVNDKNNHGFAKNSNKGIRKSYEEFEQGCFVLNMDTMVPHSKHLLQVCNAGLATPVMVDLNPDKNEGKVDEVIENLNMINEVEENGRQPSIKFAGFCMWFSKELIEKVGYLDEVFVATFEDDDICVRCCLAGLPCEVVNIKVHHYIDKRSGNEISTTGAYTSYSMQRALIQFVMKWKLPEIEHGEFNGWILENHKWKDEMRCIMSEQVQKEKPLDEAQISLVERLYDIADEVYSQLPHEFKTLWLKTEQKYSITIRRDK